MAWRKIEVRTQAELDAACKQSDLDEIALIGSGYFDLTASGSASVRAYDSASVTAYDSASVTAYDSSSVRAYDSASVRAYDSASVRASGSASVRAYGSASVRAYDSASVRASDSASVTAYGSSSVTAYGSSSVTATPYVAVSVHGRTCKVVGGVVVAIPRLGSPELWCEFHGVPVKRGVATLYKAVNDDFMSPHGTSYAPGTTPVAADWDGGLAECGGGLHFCAHPWAAMCFHSEAKRFAACPVALADLAVHPDGDISKVKAKGCCGPCVECDGDGNPILAPNAKSAA